MAFNIMDMFAAPAVNRLLQPLQNAEGVAGFTPPAGNRLQMAAADAGSTPEQSKALASVKALIDGGADPNAGILQPILGTSGGSFGLNPMQQKIAQASQAVDPMTTAATGGERPILGSMGVAQPEKKGFWGKAGDFLRSDHMQDVFEGWAMGGNDWQKSLAYGAMNASKGRRSRGEANQTVEWLKRKGVDEDTAKQVASNPATLQDYLKRLITPQDPMTVSKGAAIYDPNTKQWISPPGGGGVEPTEYGLNPQTGVDAEGNPVLIQIGKDGTATQTRMPEGVTLSKEPIKMDAGTHFVLLDPVTRQPVGQIPKENREAARETAIGKGEGEAMTEATFALPGARAMADDIGNQVKSLKEDEYLESMLGPFDSRLPNWSEDAARVQGKMDQLSGGAFLQGRQLLKGGGAITDFESKKAEQAFLRLNAAQSPKDYREALDEFEYWVRTGVTKLEQQARGAGGVQAGQARGTSGNANRTTSGTTWSIEP